MYKNTTSSIAFTSFVYIRAIIEIVLYCKKIYIPHINFESMIVDSCRSFLKGIYTPWRGKNLFESLNVARTYTSSHYNY